VSLSAGIGLARGHGDFSLPSVICAS
jgi:hypothetical protein